MPRHLKAVPPVEAERGKVVLLHGKDGGRGALKGMPEKPRGEPLAAVARVHAQAQDVLQPPLAPAQQVGDEASVALFEEALPEGKFLAEHAGPHRVGEKLRFKIGKGIGIREEGRAHD